MLFTEVSITGYNSETDFLQRQHQREGLLSETNRELLFMHFCEFASRVQFFSPLELNEVIFQGGLSISRRAES